MIIFFISNHVFLFKFYATSKTTTTTTTTKTSTKNSVELLENEKQQGVVDAVAARLGLRIVGWIFTDLLPLDISSGSVKHFRGNVVGVVEDVRTIIKLFIS